MEVDTLNALDITIETRSFPTAGFAATSHVPETGRLGRKKHGTCKVEGQNPMTRKTLPPRECTRKQTGDAAEYLTAGMMTLAGMPTVVMPGNWPHYDLIGQPPDRPPQSINVKSRREKATYSACIQLRPDKWDWFASVWIPKEGLPRFWVDSERNHSPRNEGADELRTAGRSQRT
jgi:hypothetical protein